MANINEIPGQGFLNTLAQSETDINEIPGSNEALLLGLGSDIRDKRVLKGRAKRKQIAQVTALSLISVVETKGKREGLKSLWNTYHCQNKVSTSDGRLYGKYCKNRFCPLCCSIRKAMIINNYMPIIRQWKDPQLVTLTIKAVSARSLKKFVVGLIRGFRIIKNRLRKRYERGKGISLMGIKSLECNFNPEKKTYNPHLHLIVPDKETAEILIREWLLLWTSKYATRPAQHYRPVRNTDKDMMEVIKYGSKIFTEWDARRGTAKLNLKLYAAALNNILDAMNGLRIFERFGFNLPKKKENLESPAPKYGKADLWEFSLNYADWINPASGETLAEFVIPATLVDLLENCIDTERE